MITVVMVQARRRATHRFVIMETGCPHDRFAMITRPCHLDGVPAGCR